MCGAAHERESFEHRSPKGLLRLFNGSVSKPSVNVASGASAARLYLDSHCAEYGLMWKCKCRVKTEENIK